MKQCSVDYNARVQADEVCPKEVDEMAGERLTANDAAGSRR
jgi:hypothetical protein